MSDHVRELTLVGNRVAYYDRGQGPVLLLLHGMFGDHLDWEPVLEPLSTSFRVIAPDLPGFGNSDKPDIEYSAEFFVETLHELVSSLGLSDVTLVGNSFGGSIAILYSIAHPISVARLVLVSSGGMRRYSASEVEQVNLRFSEQNVGAFSPAVQEMMLSPIFGRHSPNRDRYMAKQAAKLVRADFLDYARSLSRAARMAFPLYLRQRLTEISCPTLLVWGDADVVFPPELAHQALAILQAGKLVLLPGCGHVPQLDDPGAFAAAVREFAVLPTSSPSA